MQIRIAYKTDADALAPLIDIAREGIPSYLWRRLVEDDETPMQVGAARIADEESMFSYRKIRVAELRHEIVGLVVSFYQSAQHEARELDEFTPVVRPLVELENETADSWYINALVTDERHRNQGVGGALLQAAEDMACMMNVSRSHVVVAAENEEAISFLKRRGYSEEASRRAVAFTGCLHGGRWLLMGKALH